MSSERKETRKYVFTVEGETEQWYFEWLKDIINECPESKYNVSIVAKVQQSPQKYAKTVNPIATPSVTHICDYESNEAVHVAKFKRVLDELKAANSTIGRKFTYSLGYSNFTFELWMILHKQTCNGELADRSQYLSHINRAYQEKFESLDQYKHETNFKRCLSKITLADVCRAIERAQGIMRTKEDAQVHPVEYRGFSYYKENPSLTIWVPVKKILNECGLL